MNKKLLTAALLGGLAVAQAASAQEFDDRDSALARELVSPARPEGLRPVDPPAATGDKRGEPIQPPAKGRDVSL